MSSGGLIDLDDPRVVLANKLFCDKSVRIEDICDTLKISRRVVTTSIEVATTLARNNAAAIVTMDFRH